MKKDGQWIVDLKSVKKELKKLIKDGAISDDHLKLIEEWISQVELYGPDSLREQPFWEDHALRGKLQGYRSSSLGPTERIIYKRVDKKLVVKVIKVTGDHDYRL